MKSLEPGLLIPVNYKRTIDGDTIEFEIKRRVSIRLRDIDVAELKTEIGDNAKKFVENLFEVSNDIMVFIPTNCPEKLMDFNSFERIVADVYVNKKSLAEMLRKNGFEKVK
jgi:endonuclease YncB( thermonuclease family)